jgi:hypothetical protein
MEQVLSHNANDTVGFYSGCMQFLTMLRTAPIRLRQWGRQAVERRDTDAQTDAA